MYTIRKIDRNGRVTEYSCDSLLRQSIEEWYTDVNDTEVDFTYTTTFNDLGQMINIIDGTTETDYAYGLFGNLTSTVQTLDGLAGRG